MNRRIRDPYVRWCERTEGASPHPTRLENLFYAAVRTLPVVLSLEAQEFLQHLVRGRY